MHCRVRPGEQGMEEIVNDEEKNGGATEMTAALQTAVEPEVLTGDNEDRRRGLASDAIPLLRRLRSRIRAYATLWCAAGAVTLLLAVPALRERSFLLATTIILFGGCLVFFSLVRALEARSVSAIIEADRSEAKRKAWLLMNSFVFVTALAAFVSALVWAPPGMNPWVAVPASAFVMVVSISPAWEWFFIRRVLRANRETLEEFNRYIQLIYKTPAERQMALVAFDALSQLEALRGKGLLSDTAYQTVLSELMGIPTWK